VSRPPPPEWVRCRAVLDGRPAARTVAQLDRALRTHVSDIEAAVTASATSTTGTTLTSFQNTNLETKEETTPGSPASTSTYPDQDSSQGTTLAAPIRRGCLGGVDRSDPKHVQPLARPSGRWTPALAWYLT
jgi:hypothetical protein